MQQKTLGGLRPIQVWVFLTNFAVTWPWRVSLMRWSSLSKPQKMTKHTNVILTSSMTAGLGHFDKLNDRGDWDDRKDGRRKMKEER